MYSASAVSVPFNEPDEADIDKEMQKENKELDTFLKIKKMNK